MATGNAMVDQLDARSGRVQNRVAVGNDPAAIAASDGVAWVADDVDNTVTSIDEKTGSLNQPRITPDVQRMAQMKLQNLLPSTSNPGALTTGILNGVLGNKNGANGSSAGRVLEIPSSTTTGSARASRFC